MAGVIPRTRELKSRRGGSNSKEWAMTKMTQTLSTKGHGPFGAPHDGTPQKWHGRYLSK